eukprot:9952402-Lingulodinium_polyedra.AAC.1
MTRTGFASCFHRARYGRPIRGYREVTRLHRWRHRTGTWATGRAAMACDPKSALRLRREGRGGRGGGDNA